MTEMEPKTRVLGGWPELDVRRGRTGVVVTGEPETAGVDGDFVEQKVDDGEHVGGRRLIDDCRVVVVGHQTTGYGGRRTEQGRWLVA
jgi:hypothetical protein